MTPHHFQTPHVEPLMPASEGGQRPVQLTIEPADADRIFAALHDASMSLAPFAGAMAYRRLAADIRLQMRAGA
jgi:hypothetical protein